MADVQFLTIGDREYGRCIYADGTRHYAVVTERRNAKGMRIQRTLNTPAIIAKIDAAFIEGENTKYVPVKQVREWWPEAEEMNRRFDIEAKCSDGAKKALELIKHGKLASQANEAFNEVCGFKLRYRNRADFIALCEFYASK